MILSKLLLDNSVLLSVMLSAVSLLNIMDCVILEHIDYISVRAKSKSREVKDFSFAFVGYIFAFYFLVAQIFSKELTGLFNGLMIFLFYILP